MSGQRECWFNIYPKVYGDRQIGLPHWSEASADKALKGRRRTVECRDTPAFRIHVRLKPEGAPRRYASESEKRAWEVDAASARFAAQHGFSLRNRIGSGVYLIPARTPKTEESAS